MCGRFDLSENPRKLQIYFELQRLPLEIIYNKDVRPTNEAPIIRMEPEGRVAVLARWGLIPSWSKDAKIAQHTFNARAEGVAEKPSFRAAFKRRRCIVPATAFYEWRAVPGEKKKQKLRFTLADGAPLALAGLWESWRQPDTGEVVETFTIITTAANAFMAPIHDRMPAILAPNDWSAWLDPQQSNPLLLQSMLEPCADDWLAVATASAD